MTQFMHLASSNPKITSQHVFLYLSLFSIWNKVIFSNPITIHRDQIMPNCKIKSKSTYFKLLNELMKLNLIQFEHSFNPNKGTTIRMIDLSSMLHNEKQASPIIPNQSIKAVYKTSNLNAINSNNNNLISTEYPSSEFEIIEYFNSNNSSKSEALKFYNHYKSIGWVTAKNLPIIDWKAAAQKWILTEPLFQNKNTPSISKRSPHHLINNKNYSEPI